MATPDPREIWGPKVWRLLHLLADVSDRRDVALLWTQVMKTTADVLPCATCSHHLTTYLKSHLFMKIKQPNLVTGAQVRTQIVQELHILHNTVNRSLNKPLFPAEHLQTTYTGTREQKVLEAKAIFEELKTLWTKSLFVSVKPGPLTEWKKSVHLLAALLT